VTVAFLGVTPGAAIARSPMERSALAAGAVLELRDGWSVPVSYGDITLERGRVTRSVGFADRSRLRKLELGVARGALERAPSRPLGTATRSPGGAWWCPITPARSLVVGGAEPAPVGALDLTCAYTAVELAGPLAGELLARFCAIDVRPVAMPVGAFRPGSVARTPGFVLRTAPASLLVLVGWAFGEYMWETVARAAARLGGGPVGEDAI
jgi:glycine cleavage system aminomethyltransferase T